MGKTKLDKQAKEILKIAGESGVQSNYLFVTTFKRYRFLLESLDRLEEIIEKDGEIITKEYIKGRQNLVIHPALTKYNNIADGANKTAATLIRIIKNFNVQERSEAVDPLIKILNGSDDMEEDDSD